MLVLPLLALLLQLSSSEAFFAVVPRDRPSFSPPSTKQESLCTDIIAPTKLSISIPAILLSSLLLLSPPAFAASDATATTYDGFAEYAKEKKMEQSDVGCFFTKCLPETSALFSTPRGVQGITCLGQCKGEQSCATGCFAEYGGPALDGFLGCAVEREGCVKVPKVEGGALQSENDPGKLKSVTPFDPTTLEGTWYKTDGLNPNYDLFPCQSNVFSPLRGSTIDMDIKLRVARPNNRGFYDNELSETMVIDEGEGRVGGRTMHTGGQMYGLTFSENWWVVGESDAKSAAPYKLIAYKGHTLQGGYEGAFVYAKTAVLPDTVRAEIKDKFNSVGLDFDAFKRIDNSCPAPKDGVVEEKVEANWLDLIVGEGGVIDWVVPGWRGEYDNK